MLYIASILFIHADDCLYDRSATPFPITLEFPITLDM
jgi:hypothetical protein